MVMKKINKSNDWGIGFILQCCTRDIISLKQISLSVSVRVFVCQMRTHTNTHT